MTYSGGQRSARRAPSPSGFGPLGALFQYLGSEKASQDYTNLLRGQLPNVGRVATAELNTGFIGPQRDIYEQPGVGYFDRRSGRFLGQAPSAPQLPVVGSVAPGQGSAPIVQSSDDAYRQLLSQYGGLQKEKKYEEADKLGMEIWQKKYGKTPMAQPGGAVGAFNPLMQATFGYQKGASVTDPSYAASAAQVQPLGGQDFAIAANAVPAPWNQQGAMVDANRGVANLQPEQAKFTTGEGMPAFPTTGEKAAQLLSDPQFARLLRK